MIQQPTSSLGKHCSTQTPGLARRSDVQIVDVAAAVDPGRAEADDLIASGFSDQNDIALADWLGPPPFCHDAAQSPIQQIVWKNGAIALLPAGRVDRRNGIPVVVPDRADVHCRSRAATPGSLRPSIHSRKAPPAVETKVKSCVTPAWLSAATVSPPPATDTSEPSLVSAAAVLANATVAASNGGTSNAPSGPFHTSVRQVLSTSARASTAAGPMSRIISSGATSSTLQVRTDGGFGASSFATTTSYGR